MIVPNWPALPVGSSSPARRFIVDAQKLEKCMSHVAANRHPPGSFWKKFQKHEILVKTRIIIHNRDIGSF